MTTRFVNRFVRTKQNENQFVLWTQHNAQNETGTPDSDSFCVSPKGTHTKRIQNESACGVNQTHHQTSWQNLWHGKFTRHPYAPIWPTSQRNTQVGP